MIDFHVAVSLFGIVTGALVLGLQKGTRRHRQWGRVYALCLYAVSVSGFFIQETTDGLSIFHWFSVQAIILVTAGLAIPLFLRSRVPDWPAWHLRFMGYSYITLVLTGVVQFFGSLPLPGDALNAIVFLSLPSIAGVIVIERWGAARWRAKLRTDSGLVRVGEPAEGG